VMLGKFHRHLVMGKSRMRAALDGAQEIGFAIMATTIVLVAVFVPVACLTGRVGRLFNEFGLAVAVSVLISGFVALTLTPMLCSRLLKRRALGTGPEGEESALGHDEDASREAPRTPAAGIRSPVEEEGGLSGFDRFFQALHHGYEALLRRAMRHRG